MTCPQPGVGIVVYHRIRDLFPTFDKSRSIVNVDFDLRWSKIVQYVRQNVRELSYLEHQVTKQFSLANGRGDIILLLQQPAKAHPFQNGTQCTIISSPSLSLIDSALCAVSQGALKLSGVAVIDSLPYVRPGDSIDATKKAHIRELVRQAIDLKRSRVVIRTWGNKDVNGQMADLKNCGVPSYRETERRQRSHDGQS